MGRLTQPEVEVIARASDVGSAAAGVVVITLEKHSARIHRSLPALRSVGGAGRPLCSGKLRGCLPQVPKLHALAPLQAPHRLLEDVVHGSPVAPGIVVAGDRALRPICAWITHDVQRVRRVQERRFCGLQIRRRGGIPEIP